MRKATTIAAAAAVSLGGVGVVHAHPLSSANFGFSSQAAVEQSAEQRLLDIRTKTFLAYGYVLNEEARVYAEDLAARAAAGDFTYTDDEYSVSSSYQERVGSKTGRVFRIPREVIEAWISRDEEHYRNALLARPDTTRTERVGVAVRSDADYIYYVETSAW